MSPISVLTAKSYPTVMEKSEHSVKNNLPVAPDMSTVGYIFLIETLLTRFQATKKTSLWNETFSPYLSHLYAVQTDADWIDIGVPARLAYAREHFPSL